MTLSPSYLYSIHNGEISLGEHSKNVDLINFVVFHSYLPAERNITGAKQATLNSYLEDLL